MFATPISFFGFMVLFLCCFALQMQNKTIISKRLHLSKQMDCPEDKGLAQGLVFLTLRTGAPRSQLLIPYFFYHRGVKRSMWNGQQIQIPEGPPHPSRPHGHQNPQGFPGTLGTPRDPRDPRGPKGHPHAARDPQAPGHPQSLHSGRVVLCGPFPATTSVYHRNCLRNYSCF